MEAYHNDPMLKDLILLSLQDHYDADEIVKGQYWDNGKGCAVGCTIYSDNHKDYEALFGIPEWLAIIEEHVFEMLPNKKSKHWPIRFMSAIKPGDNLDRVKIPFLIFVVESALDNFSHKKFPECKQAIDDVLIELRRDVLNKGKLLVAAEAVIAAKRAVRFSGVRPSMKSAPILATSAADLAVQAATDGSASATSDSVWAAARSGRSARSAVFDSFADKLIELIEGEELRVR